MIYLDYNATTPVAPEVLEAMLPFLREEYGNPSSSHAAGRRAHEAVDAARGQVAKLIGASPDEIVFTSGGTEATNMALRGVVLAQPRRRHIITSSFEHPATAETCLLLERQGFRVTRVPVASDGRVRAEDVARALGEEPALVTIMHANNEIGTIQPIAEISRLAREKGAVVHTDAAQTLGKIPVDVDALGVDLLTIAGHKVYAPKGIGALYIRRGTVLASLLAGAGHERGLRPGTENVAGIVALGRACEITERDLTSVRMELRALREHLLARLQAGVDGLVLHGHPTERLPNTLFVSFPGVHGARLLDAVPEIAASTGSACHSGSSDACASLLAMGVEPAKAVGPVRLSLGRDTTVQDVEQAADRLTSAWKRLRHDLPPVRRSSLRSPEVPPSQGSPDTGTPIGAQKFMERRELREGLRRGEALVVVDVRSIEEFAADHIDGAINIPANELAARVGELPHDVTIVTVCNLGGARSCGAAQQLQKSGFGGALPLRGGIRGWQNDKRADGAPK